MITSCNYNSRKFPKPTIWTSADLIGFQPWKGWTQKSRARAKCLSAIWASDPCHVSWPWSLSLATTWHPSRPVSHAMTRCKMPGRTVRWRSRRSLKQTTISCQKLLRPASWRPRCRGWRNGPFHLPKVRSFWMTRPHCKVSAVEGAAQAGHENGIHQRRCLQELWRDTNQMPAAGRNLAVALLNPWNWNVDGFGWFWMDQNRLFLYSFVSYVGICWGEWTSIYKLFYGVHQGTGVYGSFVLFATVQFDVCLKNSVSFLSQSCQYSTGSRPIHWIHLDSI